MAAGIRGQGPQRGIGKVPDPSQLAQEDSDGHRAPSRQGVEGRFELGRRPRPMGDGAHPSSVAGVEDLREPLEARGGSIVVTGVAAGVEQLDERVPGRVAGAGHGYAGLVQHAERAHGDSGGDPGPEEHGRQEPARQLPLAFGEVDAQLRREHATEQHHAAGCLDRRR